MQIGIPTEVKTLEGRIALIPSAVAELAREHEVFVQRGAGLASGYDDDAYQMAGAHLVADAPALFDAAEMIVKVKEPQPQEYDLLRERHLLFCYLHLAAVPDLAAALTDIGLTAVAWETVAEDDGRLPLLAPMSEIAGRLAVQVAANLLLRPEGGDGVLLGGIPSTERGQVTILGAGSVGMYAARLACAMGARVVVFEQDRDRMAAAHHIGANVTALPAFKALIERNVAATDVLVGAVLIPGARAPMLVDEAMVGSMRPGSVIVDVAIDQGGCVETIRPTTWVEPTYKVHGVTHFGVTNMPGAVPRTSAQALSTAVLPYAQRLAREGGIDEPPLRRGVNVAHGRIEHAALQASLLDAQAADAPSAV